jgi:selenocysteine-specific elongation factor
MVMAQPSGLAARIRAIHNHHQEVSEIGPGTRAALNLPELPVAQRARDQGIRRGDVVTLAELGEARDVFDVLLTRISRPLEQMPLLRHGTCVRVHHGSANFVGRIFLEKGKTVEPGQTILAQIRLASPAFIFLGDRFVIRDDAEQHTHAGGIILDAETKQGRFRTPDRLECLRARARLPLEIDSILASEIKRNRIALHRTCLKKSGFSQHEIDESWRRLAENGKVLLLGDLAVDPAWWATVVDHAAAMIEAKHREHPDHLGLEVSRLRRHLPDEPALFHALVIDLRERHFIRVGEIIKRDSHRPALPANLQATGESLRNTFNSKPFDPPSIKEVATNVSAQQALQFLIRTGELVEISTEAVLTFQAFERMRTVVVSHLDRGGGATVSELRQLLGSSRRIMVPFLERLDRDGLTKREGDRRTLRR